MKTNQSASAARLVRLGNNALVAELLLKQGASKTFEGSRCCLEKETV
jgi:hypothetical protein